MSEHQHVALFQVRLDVLLVHISLLLIVDQDHDDVSHLSSLSGVVYLEALCLSLSLGLAAFVQTDNNVAAGISQVQCVCMTLAAVADDSDGLAIQKRQVTIGFVENLCFCHDNYLQRVVIQFVLRCHTTHSLTVFYYTLAVLFCQYFFQNILYKRELIILGTFIY